MIQLQREVVLMEDRVREMQESFDARSAEVSVLLEETLNRARDAQTAIAAAGDVLEKEMRRRDQGLERPMTAVSSNVDRMNSDLLGLRQTVEDLSLRLKRIEEQLSVMDTAVRVIQAPPPPPSAEGPR